MEPVRLTIEEIHGIEAAALAVFGGSLLRIRLYGSRADLSKAGGDIDLIFELRDKPVDKFLQAQKLRRELSSRLGEQKFDPL
ncbi:MAG: nucleotidyltransferase domain-containing protein [Proteobacteria bacterium]|nr:nucleotidyltransferase domain-containing protein [Pseudomonadota bacterium]